MGDRPNKHIEDLLDHYVSAPDDPGYAVLIDGPWGVGKTYYVKKYFDTRSRHEQAPIYVSLYGIESVDQFDQALLHGAYPILSWRTTKLVGRLAMAAMKYVSIDLNASAKELLDKPDKRIIIIDDLERCAMNVSMTLGYINQLVEHDGNKIVIIAHEGELAQITGYDQIREKVIGKSLKFQSAISEVIEHFMDAIPEEQLRIILKRNATKLVDIVNNATCGNFRILKQTIWDLCRLLRCLEQNRLSNREGVDALVSIYSVFSCELRAGSLKSGDLEGRRARLWSGRLAKKEEDRNDLYYVAKRHPYVEIDDPILSDDLLNDLLIHGIFNKITINDCLSRSSYYLVDDTEASWITLWYVFRRNNDQLEAAQRDFMSEFSQRKYDRPEEILHVCGIRLWLTSIGMVDGNLMEAIEDCKSYVDDLKSQSRLKGKPIGKYENLWHGSGLVYQHRDTAEFREIFEYVEMRRNEVARDSYHEIVANLRKMLEADVGKFVEVLSNANDGPSAYRRIPILRDWAAEDFISILLTKSAAELESVFSCIKHRYEYDELHGELKAEVDWLEQVREHIACKINLLPPWGRFRFSKYIEWYLDPILERSSPDGESDSLISQDVPDVM